MEKRKPWFAIGGGIKREELMEEKHYVDSSKWKLELPCNPAVSFLSINMKKTKVLIQRYICIPVYCNILSTVKIRKQPKYSLTDAWMKMRIKMYVRAYIYTHWYIIHGILLTHKKEWNLANCDNMDGPRGYYAYSKISRTEREINTIWFHFHMDSKKWTSKIKTELQRIKVVARGQNR